MVFPEVITQINVYPGSSLSAPSRKDPVCGCAMTLSRARKRYTQSHTKKLKNRKPWGGSHLYSLSVGMSTKHHLFYQTKRSIGRLFYCSTTEISEKPRAFVWFEIRIAFPALCKPIMSCIKDELITLIHFNNKFSLYLHPNFISSINTWKASN